MFDFFIRRISSLLRCWVKNQQWSREREPNRVLPGLDHSRYGEENVEVGAKRKHEIPQLHDLIEGHGCI